MPSRSHHEPLSCTFCDRSQTEARHLIAGPTVYICDGCIAACTDLVERGKPLLEGVEPTHCCSFCGKARREVKALLRGPRAFICDECLGLCRDIAAGELEREG